MAWFKKARRPIKVPTKASRVPEGLWVKCPSCGRAIYNKELVSTLQVCPQCAHHFRMIRGRSAEDAVRRWVDRARSRSAVARPLKFTEPNRTKRGSRRPSSRRGSKTRSSSARARSTACRPSSPSWGTGSSAAAWAWWSARRSREAPSSRSTTQAPLIVVSCSGGARMMEGALSLMQMAKICAALDVSIGPGSLHLDADRSDDRRRDRQLRDARRSEHRGTEGADRIRRAARDRADDQQKLPEGFQRSEFLLEKGFIDAIVDRRELKLHLSRTLRMLMGLPPRTAPTTPPAGS